MIRDIVLMIAGKAGDGVLFTGNVLAKILKRQGWNVSTFRDFPSNIKGETTNYTVRASLEKIFGLSERIDILLAFDCEAIMKHVKSLTRGGVVLCDGGEIGELPQALAEGKTFHKFLLRKLARENFGQEIYKNMIALGALSYILDLSLLPLSQIISETFLERKGKEIVQKNIEAIVLGFEKAKEMVAEKECHSLGKKKDEERLILSGDEVIAFGALAAGCRFFAAYPICPASEIWQWLAIYLPRFNGLVVQTEDELAALNMGLGASYAGVRAMTATSGPGASLMMEAFSLSGMAEIPIVIAHVQRLGPSTGMPTKTEQGDLDLWVYGSHGDFPRIILSPATLEECFEFTVKAFNLADKYQCPVVLLTELDLGQNLRTAKKFDLGKIKIERGRLLSQEELLGLKNFKRYEFSQDGISPRTIPSMKNGIHMVEGNEHDERGYRSEDPQNRVKMMEKRMRKLQFASKEVIPPKLWGEPRAKIGIVGFGSTLGPILEAMKFLKEEEIPSKYLQLRTVWPFPSKQVSKFLSSSKEVFVVESNATGQFCSLIKSQVEGCPKMRSVLKFSGQAFTAQEISNEILKAL